MRSAKTNSTAAAARSSKAERAEAELRQQGFYERVAHEEGWGNAIRAEWLAAAFSYRESLDYAQYDELYSAILVLEEAGITPDIALADDIEEADIYREQCPATFFDWYFLQKSLYAVQDILGTTAKATA